MLKRYCFAACCLLLVTCGLKAQLLYYQGTYKGGCSLDGKTYNFLDWQPADTIHFQNSVPAGCTLKKAFLFSMKETCHNLSSWPRPDIPISFQYNGNSIQFDSTSNAGPMFYNEGFQSVALKDVTALTQSSNNTLITPLQAHLCNYLFYDSFFLLLLYENSAYNTVNVALYLNNQNVVLPSMIHTLSNLNPVNTSSDIGLSIETISVSETPYLQYQLGSGSGSYNIGTIRQKSPINGMDYNTGAGSFFYQNGTLSGLVDDTPDAFVDSTDALADIKTYLPNNTNSFTLTSNTGSSQTTITNNNITLAFVMAYNTPCPARGIDTAKTYAICTGAGSSVNLSAGSNTVNTNYSWYSLTGDVNNLSTPGVVVSPTVSTNYIAYVDSAGCRHTEHFSVLVKPSPKIDSLHVKAATCGTNSGTLTAYVQGGTTPYTYNIGSGNQSGNIFFNVSAATHTLTVTDGKGCTAQQVFTPGEVNPSVASFTPKPDTACVPGSIYFYNTSTGAQNVWFVTNNDSSNLVSPTYSFTDTGAYNVTLITWYNQRRCSDTLSKTVYVKDCPPDSFSISAPNVFSPNGDGLNDTWLPIVHNYQFTVNSYQCDIYDRWGIPVFESSDIQEGWTGRSTSGMPLTAGTYFYVLHYKATGNTKGTVQEETVKGFIVLVR